MTQRHEQPVANGQLNVNNAEYARRVYGEFALHLWHRTAGSAGRAPRRVHRARG